MWSIAPSQYGTWSPVDRGMSEALVLLDSSTNEYGIPLDQALDEDLGWDVEFPRDWTVDAVEKAKRSEFGEAGMPAGVFPRVTLNPKTWARVQAERTAERARDQQSPG